jgi:hypothetical protein
MLLVGKPEGKRPLERPRCRLVDNIKMDLRATGWRGVDLIDLVQDVDRWMALVNMVLNFWAPYNAVKLLNGCVTGDFSRRVQLLELGSYWLEAWSAYDFTAIYQT